MPRRVLTPATIETAIKLREDDELSLSAIARQIGASVGALQWHFARGGIDTPKRFRRKPFIGARPRSVIRDGRPVILFTPAEDRRIEALAKRGLGNREIGLRLDPPRQPHTIRVRLMHLALYAARQDDDE